LATNAPHDPLIVDPSYAAPYKALEGGKIVSANLYGMIANIDENFGKLIDFLEERNLAENTIVIFMTDNGTRFGYSSDGKLGYNMGLRGIKGAKWEGGHRVPFFIRWPQQGIAGGRDIPQLSAHVDLLPTLAGLCGLSLPKDLELDGRDLSTLIRGQDSSLPEKSVFVHHRQDWRPPDPVQQTCILQGPWRLINGQALYHVIQDPTQRHDVAESHPELVESLLNQNAHYFASAQARPNFQELPCAVIGSEKQPEVKLTIQHAIGEARGIWKAEQVAAGVKNPNNTYAIEIAQAGTYLISCRRWPKECPGPVWGVPAENPKNLFNYQPIKPERVQIKIANQILEQMVDGKEEAVTFKVQLSPGKTLLTCDFLEGEESYGVYYTYLSKTSEEEESPD
ncbi:MAG: sulfatase-like hydrolase/transferase, partial [Bacteroidota bacterium]